MPRDTVLSHLTASVFFSVRTVNSFPSSSWWSWSSTPAKTTIAFLACSWHKELEVTCGQPCFKFNDSLAMSLGGNILPRIVDKRSTDFPSRLLEVTVSYSTPTSNPWFPDPYILCVGDTVPYTGHWFQVYTMSQGVAIQDIISKLALALVQLCL